LTIIRIRIYDLNAMYVCICNRITDHQIRAAVADGAGSLRNVCAQLSIGNGCGRCLQTTDDIIAEQRQTTAACCRLTTQPSHQAA